MSLDQISDMLTRIRNAQAAGKEDVEMPASNFKVALARLMNKYGYLKEVILFSEGEKRYLRLKLIYLDGRPAIQGIKQISKQGQRIYVKKGEVPYVKNGHGLAIISTPQGVLTDNEARKKGVGGEVICQLW
jgi:small subunit ribosomal protein S8